MVVNNWRVEVQMTTVACPALPRREMRDDEKRMGRDFPGSQR